MQERVANELEPSTGRERGEPAGEILSAAKEPYRRCDECHPERGRARESKDLAFLAALLPVPMGS